MQHPADPTRPRTYYTTQSIASGLRETPARPGLLENLIYPAKLHSLSGPPEAGKTVLGLWLCVKAMERGHNVLFVDEEAGLIQTTNILRALGASAELIDKHMTYLPFPSIRMTDSDVGGLHEMLRDLRPRLALLDSSAAMMSVAGVDENNATEVTKFWYTMLAPFAHDFKCAVLLTDHDGKAEGSRFARGSSAKLAATDVQFKLWPVRSFSREQDGLLKFTVTKDRPGWLHRHHRVRVTREPLQLDFMEATGAEDEQELDPLSERLLAVVTETPMSVTVLGERMAAKYGFRNGAQPMTEALTKLAERHLIDRMDLGPGRPVMFVKSGGTLDAPP